MVTATWTFWEWGKTRHSVLKSKEGLKKSIKQMSIVEDQVHFEVKDAYYFLQTAQHNISVAEKSVASAEENLRISKERYKEQVAIVTEVLDAETRLTRARTFLTNALNDYNVAMATLYWAIGME
jgi:outer membrane protein